MNYRQITDNIMFQTNNDIEDKEEFIIALPFYVNEGYGKLCDAFWKMFPSEGGKISPLKLDTDVPNLPQYAHRGICDYATYLVYRNGNPVKQNRGERYLRDFMEVLGRLREDGSKLGDIYEEDGRLLQAEAAMQKKRALQHRNIFTPLAVFDGVKNRNSPF